jgi:transposase
MYYIRLDVHKKTISYCVKDVSGQIQQEGKVGSTRRELDCWMKALPLPWSAGMEATIFSGWIYDHLLPHATQIKVAHPLMLRAIAPAKKKNDQIDASKIADRLRCDFLPESHMMPREIPGSTPHLALSTSTGATDGSDEEPGLWTSDGDRRGVQQATAAQGELLPRSALNQHGGSSEHTAVAEAEPVDDRAVSEDRVRSGQFSATRSCVGRQSQTTENGSWRRPDHGADMGRLRSAMSRFRTIKNAISYCGFCEDERSSAGKMMSMPLSKQRNKHIQRALVEAAKLAPRQSHELAVIYDKEKQRGNGNRATLAVARKMVAYLLAVDRQQRDFLPVEERWAGAA